MFPPRVALAFPLLLVAATPAKAGEVFVGLYAHDVDTPLNLRGFNEGVDLQIGWRGERMRSLAAIGSPSPYAFVGVNSADDVHYAVAGIGWKLGGRIYVRPGIGLAVHSGPTAPRAPQPARGLGSRILFEPELAVGAAIGARVSLEASWMHMSHGGLLDAHNPGIDNVGLRVNYRF